MTYTVAERFLKYVKVDTQADPYSDTFPSTAKQKDLTKIVMDELHEMGMKAETNDAGYIYATLPSNIDKKVKRVFFCAHLDTAPDCSGTNVKPIVHRNYQGEDIVLPDDTSQVLTTGNHPILKSKIGHDIVTASGLTLLGSDDKSGVAVIMDAFYQLIHNPEIPHGDVSLLFTTDEEIGKGTANVEIERVNADFGYTLDGGDLGHFESENFSADKAVINITGVSAHPGYAKGKMENAIKIASEIIAALPKDGLSPETTSGKEGFVHPNKIEGGLENARLEFIIRDFVTDNLARHEQLLEDITKKVLENYPGSQYEMIVKEQYRNMKDVLDDHPYVIDYAVKAMERVGVKPHIGSIRGGTDGSMLSHMGLPCPNLFAGEQAIHSKHEWVSIQDMQKAVDTVVEIVKVTAEKV